MCKFNMFITAVCVLFLIKLRWPKNKSIYDTEYTNYSNNNNNNNNTNINTHNSNFES